MSAYATNARTTVFAVAASLCLNVAAESVERGVHLLGRGEDFFWRDVPTEAPSNVFRLSTSASPRETLGFSASGDDGGENESVPHASPGNEDLAASKFDPRSVHLKFSVENGVARMLATFPDADESRRHRPWRWDRDRQTYVPDESQLEDALLVIWRDAAGALIDVWLWGAGRTDPAGFADDFHLSVDALSEAGTVARAVLDGEMEPDRGGWCWRSSFPTGFVGETAPRFHPRTPTEGRADVRARGKWRDGRWTVEFARKVVSDDAGDLDLSRSGARPTLIIPDSSGGGAWVAAFPAVTVEGE